MLQIMFSFNTKESSSMKQDLKCGKKYSVTSEGIKIKYLEVILEHCKKNNVIVEKYPEILDIELIT